MYPISLFRFHTTVSRLCYRCVFVRGGGKVPLVSGPFWGGGVGIPGVGGIWGIGTSGVGIPRRVYLPPPVLTPSGSLQNRYGWPGGTHPTGMLLKIKITKMLDLPCVLSFFKVEGKLCQDSFCITWDYKAPTCEMTCIDDILRVFQVKLTTMQ